ncbi:FecR family protein [Pararobbsia silviterrae]|nr:FecR domain-containing protein [Pararobbsia silviterrae]
MPTHLIAHIAFLACGGLSCIAVQAADSMGTIKTLKGAVHIERGAHTVDTQVGSEVFANDRVVTGPDSSVGITLRDDTLLTEGANSVLELNKFAFNTTTYDGALDATIRHGSLSVVDGKLAKANPDAVRYSTPTTTLGVRGTEFIIEVGGDGGSGH